MVVFCFWACNDNSAGSGVNESKYSFNLNVTDDSGNPLSGLEFWVKYGLLGLGSVNSNFGRESTNLPLTTIQFAIAEESKNVLSLYKGK